MPQDPRKQGPQPAPPPSPFEQLLPCKWRDVEFPISSMRLSFSQDTTEHKYWGKDGASVEATGRAPMIIDATIPFFNGIFPAKNERGWRAGNLYPEVFRAFIKAFADRTTDVLIHPELDQITCKPRSIDFSLEPTHRDGVEVRAQWVETVEPFDDGRVAVGKSNVTQLAEAARNLDVAIESRNANKALAKKWSAVPVMKVSFETSMNKLAASFDRISTRAQLVANKPNQVAFRVKQVVSSAERAGTALTWPVIDAATSARLALHDLAKQAGSGGRAVLRYTTPTRMTLSGILAAIGTATADDLIKLNPQLVSAPEVGPKTVIRYFKP